MASAFMAAQPVMACCITGHAAPAVEMAGMDGLPCHNDDADGTIRANNDHRSMPHADNCSGCPDCNLPVMQGQVSGDTSVPPQPAPEVALAVLAAQYPGYVPPPLILTTGPPAGPPLAPVTLLTLKQRLLI
ncbi:MAG TPA: hypothetical protein PKV67_00875 [Hyphomonas sp.]|nr:hypothetical protein [Hyphomonas sp.]